MRYRKITLTLQAKAKEAAQILFAIEGVFGFQWQLTKPTSGWRLFVFGSDANALLHLPEKFDGVFVVGIEATYYRGNDVLQEIHAWCNIC